MHALFVDDEVEFLQLMEKRLSRRGMTIVTAPDGQSALDIVTEAMKQPETMFQVVVMDVRMPGMDGLEAAKAIIGEFPDANIVMVSSLAYDDTMDTAEEIGAKDLIYFISLIIIFLALARHYICKNRF